MAAAAGPASASLAKDIPARARMMSTAVSGTQGRGEMLGLQSRLLPYWQQGVAPTEAWHAYEKGSGFYSACQQALRGWRCVSCHAETPGWQDLWLLY